MTHRGPFQPLHSVILWFTVTLKETQQTS